MREIYKNKSSSDLIEENFSCLNCLLWLLSTYLIESSSLSLLYNKFIVLGSLGHWPFIWALEVNRALTIGTVCGKVENSWAHSIIVGSGPNHEESVRSQCQDQFLNLEWRKDREVSVHTTYNSRSHSRGGSHVSHGENARNMQLEIDHLQRKLRCKQMRWTPSSSKSHYDDNDGGCRPRSMTPPSESFSSDENCHHGQKSKSLSRRGLENDAISRVLHQISKSPFTRRTKGGKLPRRFT